MSEAIQGDVNLQNNLDLPEVILLDGGKGQLNTVKKLIKIFRENKNNFCFKGSKSKNMTSCMQKKAIMNLLTKVKYRSLFN